LHAHVNLKGSIFKRKLLDPWRVHGLGYFGLAGATYAMFPHVALLVGPTLTTGLITAASLGGMMKLNERGYVNSIALVGDGEHAGSVQFSVSTSPFTSKNLIASVNDVQSVCSVGNDGVGEDDIEGNIIHLKSCLDTSSGQVLKGETI